MIYAVVTEDVHCEKNVLLFDEWSSACAYVRKEYEQLLEDPDKTEWNHEEDYSWAQVAWRPDRDFMNPRPEDRMCFTLTVVPVSKLN